MSSASTVNRGFTLFVLEVLEAVDDVQVDAVETRTEDLLQVGAIVTEDDGLPVLVPVLDLVVAGPIRILGFDERRAADLPRVLPVVAVGLRLT